MGISLAGCVILDGMGRVLLIHRNTLKRVQWETVGGKVEFGESPSAAARREAREETGIDVAIGQKIGVCEFMEAGHAMAYTWFLATIKSGEPVIKEPRTHDDLRYFSWEELKNMAGQLSQNVRELVGAHSRGKIKYNKIN